MEPVTTPPTEPQHPATVNSTAVNSRVISDTPENKGAVQNEATPTAQPAPSITGIPAEEMEKIKTKYGGDVNKYWEGKRNAESKMHEATTQLQELRKELDSIKNAQVQAQQPNLQHAQQGRYPMTVPYSAWDAETRERFYQEFGKSPEQWDTDMRIDNLTAMTAESRLEAIKSMNKTSNPDFIPEVEAEFDKLIKSYPPKDRIIPQVVNGCIELAIGKHRDKVWAERERKLRSEFQTGGPVQPNPTVPPASGHIPQTTQINMTPEELENAARVSGYTVDELKAKITGGNR